MSNGKKVTDVSTVLKKWQSDFAGLLAPGLIFQDEEEYQMQHNLKRVSLSTISDHWDSIVSKEEVSQAVWSQKIRKAPGPDHIPAEVLKNEVCVGFFTTLCLEKCSIPSAWKTATIVPIPKDNMKDPTDPFQYRGISLLSIPYKVFAKILDHRFSEWLEDRNIMSEEQNGFRPGRGTVEHIGNIDLTIQECKEVLSSIFYRMEKVQWEKEVLSKAKLRT